MPLNWIQFEILNGLDVAKIHIKKICSIIWSISQHFMCFIFQNKTCWSYSILFFWFSFSQKKLCFPHSFISSSSWFIILFHPIISLIHDTWQNILSHVLKNMSLASTGYS
jgi:hypothetical protein